MTQYTVTDNKSLENIINIVYPIGSIYFSVNSVSPQTLFGGEWTQIKDTFLLACGNSYVNGVTGGEVNHTLTVSEMPSHGHEAVSTSGSDRGLALYPFSMITQNIFNYCIFISIVNM